MTEARMMHYIDKHVWIKTDNDKKVSGRLTRVLTHGVVLECQPAGRMHLTYKQIKDAGMVTA